MSSARKIGSYRRLALMLAAVTALFLALSSRALTDAQPLAPHAAILIPRAVGYFDYMIADQRRRRLVVSHTESQSVAFVNLDTGRLERQLYLGAAPHGIALAEKDGAYYVGTSGAEHGVVAIDRTTLEIRSRIHTPGPVDALAFDSRRGALYADEDDGNSIWIIATPERRIIATLRTPRDSDKIEYDPHTDRLYQNFTTTNSVLVIDPATHSPLASWSSLPALRPHGLVTDRARNRLFVAGVNGKLVVIDLRNGRVTASLAIAPHVDQIAIDAARRRVYCASNDGYVSVIDASGQAARLLANVPVPRGSHTVAVDQATGAVWVSYGTQRDDYVLRLDPH